jgi:hypothetical protein
MSRRNVYHTGALRLQTREVDGVNVAFVAVYPPEVHGLILDVGFGQVSLWLCGKVRTRNQFRQSKLPNLVPSDRLTLGTFTVMPDGSMRYKAGEPTCKSVELREVQTTYLLK